MNKQIKYSLLVVLAFALTISFANAMIIGQSTQSRPYESNPSSVTKSNTLTTWPIANPTMMYDGDLMTFGSFRTPTAAISTPLFAWLQIAGFANTPPEEYPIAWVDFKMRYQVPAFTDEYVRIEYSVSGSSWVVISPDAYGPAAKFPAGTGAATRPWANLVEPNDGVWDWTDINGFAVRFYLTKGPTAWDTSKFIYVYEAWLTIYETAPPTTTGSATVSLQPGIVRGVVPPAGVPFIGSELFVDVYVRDVAALWGYQFLIQYDTNVLSAVDGAFWSYNIFDTPAPYYIDETLGEISISFTSFGGDLVGFTGDMPLARIIFSIDGGGSTALHIDTDPAKSLLTEAGTGDVMPVTFVDGFFSSGIVMSFNGGMVPGAPPIGGSWHELYPHYSNTYTLTSWVDNADGYLSASDQIDMTDAAGWLYWYHVDVVTTTIHFTFKPPGEGLGDAESEVPMTEMPTGSPVDSRWHMVYPEYCRMFTITSWTDNDVNGDFNPSDQFDFEFDDDPGVPVWAHLDSVTTDIILSQKGPGEPPIPEFPLGIGLIFAVAPLISIIYLWRIKPRRKV